MRSTAWASLVILGLPFLLLLKACVPAREFKALDDKYRGLQDHVAALEHTNDTLHTSLREVRAALATNTERWNRAQRYADSVDVLLRHLQESNSRLQNDYNTLESLHQTLMAGNQKETGRLLTEIQQTQTQLQEREDALKELERQLYQRRLEQEKEAKRQKEDQARLDSLRNNLQQMEGHIAQKNARIAELQQAIDRQDSLSRALRDRIANALFSFEGKGLTVYQKNGRVYVSLEEQLLFKPGKYDVDAKGREAILALGKVLTQHPELHIEVEGHTDDVPMKGAGQIKDNWDLSVMRATAIVRLLTTQAHINPKQVAAAGRGEYYPLDPAKTAEARKKNRRTEIILIPQIDKILNLVQE